MRLLHPQTARQVIGPILQLLDGILNPAPHVRADIIGIVQGCRNCRYRSASRLSDVSNRNVSSHPFAFRLQRIPPHADKRVSSFPVFLDIPRNISASTGTIAATGSLILMVWHWPATVRLRADVKIPRVPVHKY